METIFDGAFWVPGGKMGRQYLKINELHPSGPFKGLLGSPQLAGFHLFTPPFLSKTVHQEGGFQAQEEGPGTKSIGGIAGPIKPMPQDAG